MGSITFANYFLMTYFPHVYYFMSFLDVEPLVIIQIFASVGPGFKPD